MGEITQIYLRECFDYDPNTGKVTWRHRPQKHFVDNRVYKIWNTRWEGKQAGSVMKASIDIDLFGKPRRSHRLIWLWVTGDDPQTIDHLNGNPFDNRWCNLRNGNVQQNTKNRRKQSNNTSGVTGVHHYRATGRYQAFIGVNGNNIHLGFYKTKVEAAKARKKAEKFYKFTKRHGR
jgi:hypothetical protein